MQCIEVKLGVHAYFSASMTTMNENGLREYRDCVMDSKNVTTLTMCKLYVKHVLHLISILSPFLFIPSLYASFLKFVGFFYLLVSSHVIFSQCKLLSEGKPLLKYL